MPQTLIEDYQVGWICALPKELTAARCMLDEEYTEWPNGIPQDCNSYILGEVHTHKVVIACLPAGRYGTTSAALVASNMLRTFTNIRIGLMVGIGGGIPNLDKHRDIRLGDVVVSQPEGTHSGVVQYDLKVNKKDGVYELKGFLQPPPTFLLTALANLQSRHLMHGTEIPTILAKVAQRMPQIAGNGYTYQGSDRDILHCSNVHDHQHTEACSRCKQGIMHRQPRASSDPVVHYGTIASGNELIRNVVERDRLGRELDAKCIEMEAAGLMNDFPCLVIRGICDYADAFKNDVWQEYAAITAAALARELLGTVKSKEVIPAKPALPNSDAIGYPPSFKQGLNLFDAPDMDRNLFVGRESDIQAMEDFVHIHSPSLGSKREVLVLGGFGGLGKTQLAISFAHRHRLVFDSIFWLNAKSQVTLQASLRRMAECISPNSDSMALSGEKLQIYIKRWLSVAENVRWMLIFDNYDEPEEFDLREYYPYASHGTIVITTRRPSQVSGRILSLQPLQDIDHGLQILETRSRREHLSKDPYARLLCERLSGLPLALATAGSFLCQTTLSFQQYLSAYETRWKISSDRDVSLLEYEDRTLYTTWDLSYSQLEKKDYNAAQLLRLLCFFDHQAFWFELLHAGDRATLPDWLRAVIGDSLEFHSILRVLIDYCFIEIQSTTKQVYSMHTCIHDWTLASLNTPVQSDGYWFVSACIAGSIASNDWRSYDWRSYGGTKYTPLVPHAVRLANEKFDQVGQDIPESSREDMDIIVELLRQQLQHDSTYVLLKRSLADKEKAFGPDHRLTLSVVDRLAGLYRRQGDFEEAERLHIRALSGKEKVLGPNHQSTASSVHNLGLLYYKQRKYDEAERLYTRALDIREQTLGLEHESTLTTITNLGLCSEKKGKYEEAENLYNRALAGKEKRLGPDNPSTLTTVHNLGLLYYRQGKLDEAERQYIRVMGGMEKVYGPGHLSNYDTLRNLGFVYRKQGRYGKAEEAFTRALVCTEKGTGLDSITTIDMVYELGCMCEKQGKLDRAEQFFQRAVSGYEKALGPDNSATKQATKALAEVRSAPIKTSQATLIEPDPIRETSNPIPPEATTRASDSEEDSAVSTPKLRTRDRLRNLFGFKSRSSIRLQDR